MTVLTELFKPITVGGVKIKNRIVMLPMGAGDAVDYYCTPEIVDFYEKRARGGTGLIIVGSLMVNDLRGATPYYISTPQSIGIFLDEHISHLRKLTEAMHKHGAVASAQLEIHYDWCPKPGAPAESAGPSVGPSGHLIPPMREMSIAEIKQVVNEYGEAGRRAREAGFDMVDIHSGIGYFLSRWLSPYSNKRTDEYGGSIENRTRLLREIIESIKEKAGKDYPVTVRFSGEDFMPGGNTLADSLQIAPILEKAGYCALNIQVGFHESPRPLVQRWTPQGAYVYVAEAIKKVVSIPVITAYRISDPLLAERILVEGKADMIGMCRSLIADPELPNKAQSGKLDDICACMCCVRCLDDRREAKIISCSVNSQEGKPAWKLADKQKKVLVIGGGPAGMETARIAALRGHQVTLYEQSSMLGGQANLASKINPDLGRWVKYMKRQMQTLPVNVKLNSSATAAEIDKLKLDVIVVAAGGVYPARRIPGADNANTLDIFSPELLKWAHGENIKVKNNVVIIGAGFAGCGLAEMMAKEGRNVTLLEQSKRIGSDIAMTERWYVKIKLNELKVNIITGATVEDINTGEVKVRVDNSMQTIPADTVIFTEALMPDSTLYNELAGKAPEVYSVGDCNMTGRIREATTAAYLVASKI